MLTTVVCVKICVDTRQLASDPRTGQPRLERAAQRIGPCDENAIEEAVRLRQQHGGRVLAVTLVPEEPAPDVLFKVLAMGVDEMFLIQDSTLAQADCLAVARILGAALRRLGAWDLVLCGEGSGDQYNRQVGPRLAEELGLPSLTYVSRLELRGPSIVAERTLEEQVETVETALPALATLTQEINEPRLPTVLQIKGAMRKPLRRWGLGELGFPAGTTALSMSALRTLEIRASASARKRQAVRGETVEQVAGALARALFEEGVVRLQ